MEKQNILNYFKYGEFPSDPDEQFFITLITPLIKEGKNQKPFTDASITTLAILLHRDSFKNFSTNDLRMLANGCLLAKMSSRYNHVKSPQQREEPMGKLESIFPKGVFKNAIKDHFLKDGIQGQGTEEKLRGVI